MKRRPSLKNLILQYKFIGYLKNLLSITSMLQKHNYVLENRKRQVFCEIDALHLQ